VGSELSTPGLWRVRVDALVSDFDKAVIVLDVPVR
jgi:hypothetical protein